MPNTMLIPWCYDCGREAEATCWAFHHVRRRPDPATARSKFPRRVYLRRRFADLNIKVGHE